jgi:hypothetical protein
MPNDSKISGGDETVECRFTQDGIEIWKLTPNEERQFSMPWPWLELIKKEITKQTPIQKIVVERPQAEWGLKGYSQ